ncbi:hypothetical protein BJ973_003859 [Actinoplanes tereljensis]|uniref:DUF2264 domain-containing protein n=1 Tax=Paractinoplanes tereljensis TaxID=571912 RepID=A0A919TWW1_9ACTN|nr:DUF2264 domain-containing protein [Actinoplanes tereljensis]GIF25581.1 hypothetical protein Ate02nite_83110 [Actinoplanes tereljensis]
MPENHSRDDWLALADRMLTAARRHASPGHALINVPGTEGGFGRSVDGLEGFARTFLLAGFRIAGERGRGLDELAEWYAAGLAAGTDPKAPDEERWTRLDEHGQAKVEAASIALILDLTRPWIWDRLTPQVQEQVVDYLSPAVGDDTYPQINWVWFRLVVQTFLRSVGGPWSGTEMVDDLRAHDSFRRSGGWLADGPSRAYDHYTGWALHLYPILWARMAGASDLADSRRDRDIADLDRYLRDAITLVGADGSPLIQGRSLTYRFAAAAPFWAGALAGVPSTSPGALRHAADRIVHHFADHGAPDADGLLSIGWHGRWPRIAQSYSGPGSPYWASKGMLGVALPAGHPVWTAPAEPLPIETGDVLRAVRAPGWLISGSKADGIVRVINHGTDHDVEGATTGDSPLYARIGYSTATFPILDESGWTEPLDQSVVLVDDSGRRSHRTGFRTLDVRIDGEVGVAGSTGVAHWNTPIPDQRDHGSGRLGQSVEAGEITVFSLVRGPWEIRLAHTDRAGTLRMGGWPVTADLHSHLIPLISAPNVSGTNVSRPNVRETNVRVANVSETNVREANVRETNVRATNVGGANGGVEAHDGPLGATTVPWLDWPVGPGEWVAALVGLSRDPAPPTATAEIDHGWEVRATWPDGVTTRTPLTKE